MGITMGAIPTTRGSVAPTSLTKRRRGEAAIKLAVTKIYFFFPLSEDMRM